MTAHQHETTAAGPVRLYDEATGRLVAEITPRELRQLQDALEEEFAALSGHTVENELMALKAARQTRALQGAPPKQLRAPQP